MGFSSDYVTARHRFREAAERLGWMCHAYSTGTAGLHGEDLTIDVATSLPTQTDRALVISSGLHGVEGHFGSAIQEELLERWKRDSGVPRAVRCVLVHALNPYGFAWSRRFDDDNIDLNRNILTEAMPYTGSTDDYRRFNRLLNPRHAPSGWDFFCARALWAMVIHGTPALKQALATGQYDFPKGLFFGGRGPSRTRKLLQQHMKSWIGNPPRQ